MTDDNIRECDRKCFDRLEAMFVELKTSMNAPLKRTDNLENRIDAVSEMSRAEAVALRADFIALSKRVDKWLAAISAPESRP